MKKLYSLNSLKNLLVLCFFVITINVNATVWGTSDASASYDQCSGTATIRLLSYFDDCWACDADYLKNASFYFKLNGSWVRYASMGGDSGCNANASSQNGYSITSTRDGSCGGSAFVNVRINNLPTAVLNGGQIELRVTGEAADDATPDTQFDWVLTSQTIPSIPDPTGLTASIDNCNGITLNWTNPTTIPACLQGIAKIQILKAGAVYTTVNYPTSTYTDTGNVPAGADRSYQVKLIYQYASTRIKESAPTSAAVGRKKDVPVVPSNLQASTVNCDATVDLSWEWNSASPENFQLYRDGVAITPLLGGTLRNFTDNNIVRGQNYSYQIRAKNDCGWSVLSTPGVIGNSPLGPAKPADLNATLIPGVGIQLTWPITARTVSYKIERSLLGGGGSSFFDPDGAVDDTSYLDVSLVECQTYEYRLRAFNDCSTQGVLCDTVVSTRLVPDLTTTFDTTLANNSLRASKGYFPDRVELDWTLVNNANFINQFKIYRKIAGTNVDSVNIQTLNSGSNIFSDNQAVAGVLYKYTIVAETQCEQTTVYSNACSSIGFRSPFGTVSGQVSYTGGIAVKDVKIAANSSSGAVGNAISFNGTSRLQVPNNTNLNASNGLTVEFWMKPTTHSVDFTLAEKSGTFSVKHVGSNYVFRVFNAALNSQTISIPDSYVNLNNYNQFTASLYNDTVRLFLNGVSTSFSLFSGFTLGNTTSPLLIGQGFIGIMDEFRYWTIGKAQATVLKDFSRQLSGGESGLKVYLKMNEGIGTYAYDFSRTAVTTFNRNHAAFVAGPTWSATIPNASQLSLAAYTDAQGNYVMAIPYNGNGETFVLTPSYLVHSFTPSTRALFIGDGSAVFNNIDFTDISSFTVQGRLVYSNTSCMVEGATLKIDGNPVVVNGTIAQTDAQGNFLIQVPIGQHYLTIEKAGHYMNIGRFPATGTHNFLNDLAGVNFEDSTYLKIVGRVVGGLKEASYIPGLGKSNNNIGTAQIILKSQQGNGCFTDTIYTDSHGEYTTYAPPLRYVPSVKIPANPSINFGVLNLVDLTTATAEITRYDSLGIGNIDSISFNMQLDYIYRVLPKLVVKDKNLVDDFIGDSIYLYVHPNGDSIIRDLRVNPLPWPVFNGIGREAWYTCLITAFEEYQHPVTGALDTVPTTDGTLVINNQICEVDSGELELSEINTLDSLQYLYYKFKLGSPNFNQNVNIPQYSYVKTFEINVLLPSGTSVSWRPDVFRGTPTGQFPAIYDQIFRGYVLGTKSDGQQFVTAGPEVPEYILRDPPGGSSSAKRGIGTTKASSNNWEWSLGTSVGTEDKILLGTKITTGIGVAIETDIENNLVAGFSANIKGGNSGNESVTITNTEEWSTNSSSDLPGAGSDLYIGKSKNVTFGISETLKLVPDSTCSQAVCLGNPIDDLSFSKSYGLSIVPGGYETQFIYNQNQITGYLIPDLIDFRNALLDSDPRYVSALSPSHPNYGKNNDDPVFNPLIAQMTSNEKIEYILKIGDSTYMDASGYNMLSNITLRTSSAAQKAKWEALNETTNPDFTVLSGTSYTYLAANEQDSLTGDSVRWINNQIKHWQDAIMLNEWEKVNISDPAIKTKLKQVEMTKLVEKYKSPIKAYEDLIALGAVFGGPAALASILAPYPGAAFVGYAAFAITTGVGIGIAEVYEEVLQFQNQKQLIESKFNQTSANYSISGGNSYTSSVTHESSSTYTNSVEYGMSASLALEVSAKVNNIGVGYKKSLGLDFSSGRDWSTTTGSTETVSFTLEDPDQGDYFSVDMFPSLLGWGPIFKLRPGGATACPHEDAKLTQFYLDAPGNQGSNPNYPSFALNARTFQIDKPTISAAPTFLTNIPVTDDAVYNLTINNESEANYPRTYTVAVYSASNPFGAIVRIDGSSTADVVVPPGSSVNKVLTVSKGAGPVYNYDSLLVLVYAPCQYQAGTSDNGDIVDSVYITAHFLPTCTEVNFANPDDQWVLNNFAEDTLPIAIIDYNINFFDFNSIRLDYKASSQSQWTGLQTFYRDTTGLNNPTALLIPTSTSSTEWDWLVGQLPDGDYDLRLVSECDLANKISVTHSGLMDRINPHPFGTPSPADGILDPNDDILIRMNEPIELGSLTSLNFDVRGVINGASSNHASNLLFDGLNDYVEVSAGAPLQNRDFTIEFSVKRLGTGAEAVLSQGSNSGEQFYIGFDATNHLVFKINEQSIASLNTYTDNEWHYFAVSYDYDNENADMYEASEITTAAIINNGNSNFYAKYTGADRFNIGRDLASGSYFFGHIDDVRIWNTARTLSEFSLLKTAFLSANEPGLLYNWRFDEADGIFAEDHVRSRDGVINGATWVVEPGGSAVTFDGIDEFVKLGKGDVNITKGMDFTLEFWYNSLQSGPATLVSNGKADGIAPDSIYAWNINKDAAGIIHVLHNGIDFVATNTNTFDGEWHHFALVLNRTGNLTSYLDGNLERSTQALPFGEFGGPAIHLGARGFIVGAMDTVDSFFQGQIDEFRLWDASRKFEQIARDKQNRMMGDEYALRLYLPFEDYQLDPTGIPILTPSYAEQIDMASHTVINANGATLTGNTPKIKIPRPVESIAFTYSLNNDEIIITPTTDPALIENVTLDITVKDLKDLHGNVMESPKTWIAYVDKNQVVWQDDALSFNKEFGAALSFSSGISNEGGAAKNFTIENLPSWLSASPTSGIIAPNSSMTVNFVVDPNVNIGDYSQDIHLLTDFGFPEKLIIDLIVRNQEPTWSVDESAFINSMGIIGYLKIKDVVSTSDEDMLAVFVNDECRGVAHLQYVPQFDRYYAFLSVYSNLSSGEDLKFKIWDASSGTVYSDVYPDTLSFIENAIVGTIGSPQLFETNYEIAVEIPVVNGWNWISDFLYNVDSTNLDLTLGSLEAVLGDEIKTLNDVYSQFNGSNWVGEINLEGIRPEVGYKLKVSSQDTLVFRGDIIDPTTRTIDLVTGWNWIGFISVRNQSVNQALANLNATNGDIIKSKTAFAMYDSLVGWIGNLQAMIPGRSYMYYSQDNVSFVYPYAGYFKSGNAINQEEFTNELWTVNVDAYANNMTVIATLDGSCDYLNKNENLVLGVFAGDNSCRAMSPINLVNEDLNLSYLTIGGSGDENLSYSLLDLNTQHTYDLKQSLTYQSNKHFGTLQSPLKISINDEVCMKMKSDAGLIEEWFRVYPTVIEDEIVLEYLAQNEDPNASIVIYNIWGQKVLEYKQLMSKGFNKVNLSLLNENLAAGVYHFVLESNGESRSVKLINQ